LFWILGADLPVPSAKMMIAASHEPEVAKRKDDDMPRRLISSSSTLSLCRLMILVGYWLWGSFIPRTQQLTTDVPLNAAGK
jgi:hypothetical protein